MTTLADTGTVLASTTPAQTRRRISLVSLAMIAVTIVVSVLLLPFLTGNHSSAADIEILRILSAAFAPSIVGLLLAFFGSGLPDDGKQ